MFNINITKKGIHTILPMLIYFSIDIFFSFDRSKSFSIGFVTWKYNTKRTNENTLLSNDFHCIWNKTFFSIFVSISILLFHTISTEQWIRNLVIVNHHNAKFILSGFNNNEGESVLNLFSVEFVWCLEY